jgi:deoxyribonuclease V
MIEYEPDLVMVDGQGIAHPRRLGIASHLGLVLDKPTIGVAKSRLVGKHAEVGLEPGERTNLYDKEEIIGVVVRTKARSKPLYVSIGNRVDLETSVHFVLSSIRGYRLPEPTRQAHLASKAATEPCHILERG